MVINVYGTKLVSRNFLKAVLSRLHKGTVYDFNFYALTPGSNLQFMTILNGYYGEAFVSGLPAGNIQCFTTKICEVLELLFCQNSIAALR